MSSRKKLKFYISSRVKKRDLTRSLIHQLRSRGHTISFDWTTYPSAKPYHENKEEAAKGSEAMIRGVKSCDVFILFLDLRGGTGMFVELGVALAAKRRVFIIAPRITRPIFFFHPLITHVRSIKELLGEI